MTEGKKLVNARILENDIQYIYTYSVHTRHRYIYIYIF